MLDEISPVEQARRQKARLIKNLAIAETLLIETDPKDPFYEVIKQVVALDQAGIKNCDSVIDLGTREPNALYEAAQTLTVNQTQRYLPFVDEFLGIVSRILKSK